MNGDLAYTHEFVMRLEEPLRVISLDDAMPAGDSRAHVFRLRLPQGLPQSAAAYAVRPDGISVLIPCEMNADIISFSLPAEAVVIPGRVDLLVRGMAGERLTTLLWCRFTASPGVSGQLTDPAQLVPSLQSLLARIGECEAAAARADAMADQTQEALADLTQGMEDAVAPVRERVRDAEDRLDDCEAGLLSLQDSLGDTEDRVGNLMTIALGNRTGLQNAQIRLDAHDEALSAQGERLNQTESGVAGAQVCLGNHGVRLTALQGVTQPDSLAAMFCPRFALSGSALTCFPSPGTTVHVSAEESAVWHASGGMLWLCRDFVGGESVYYVTGGTDGEDILLPPGTWTISWHADGVPDDDSYGVIYRFSGMDQVRVNRSGSSGSVVITVPGATAMSLWFYNSSGGWGKVGCPPMTVMIAAECMEGAGLPAESRIQTAADSFIAPAAHGPVVVWTEDGSPVTVRGYEAIPHCMERLAVK